VRFCVCLSCSGLSVGEAGYSFASPLSLLFSCLKLSSLSRFTYSGVRIDCFSSCELFIFLCVIL